jgi:hypothetical protein
MIALSNREPVAWSPEWLAASGERPRFLFRAGTVVERAGLEAELAGEHRAGRVFDFELSAAFEEGVKALLSDNQDGANQLVEWARAEAALVGNEKLPDEEAASLAGAREALAEHWPPYKALLGRLERRKALAPVVAFRRFCVGWEGNDLPPFTKAIDGTVTLDAMGALDALTVQAGGFFAYQLLYGGGVEKNASALPGQRDSAQETSPSGATGKAGSSATKSGSKTRSSRSSPKSSPSLTSGASAGG